MQIVIDSGQILSSPTETFLNHIGERKWYQFSIRLAIHNWDWSTTFNESDTKEKGTIIVIVINVIVDIIAIMIITTSIVGTYRKMWDIVVKKLETADRSMPLLIIIWIYGDNDDVDEDGEWWWWWWVTHIYRKTPSDNQDCANDISFTDGNSNQMISGEKSTLLVINEYRKGIEKDKYL